MNLFPDLHQRIRVNRALKMKIARASRPPTLKQIALFFISANTQLQLEVLRHYHHRLDYDSPLEPTREENALISIRPCTTGQVRTYLKKYPDIMEDLQRLRRAWKMQNSIKRRKQNKRRTLAEQIPINRASDQDDSNISLSSETHSLADQNQEIEVFSPAIPENNHSRGQLQTVFLNDMFNHMTQDNRNLRTNNLLESIGIVSVCNVLKNLPGYDMMRILEGSLGN